MHAKLAHPQGPPTHRPQVSPMSPPPSVSTDPRHTGLPPTPCSPCAPLSSCCLPPTHHQPGLCPFRPHRDTLPRNPLLSAPHAPTQCSSPAPYTGTPAGQGFSPLPRTSPGTPGSPRLGAPAQLGRPRTLARTVTKSLRVFSSAPARDLCAASSTLSRWCSPDSRSAVYSLDLGASAARSGNPPSTETPSVPEPDPRGMPLGRPTSRQWGDSPRGRQVGGGLLNEPPRGALCQDPHPQRLLQLPGEEHLPVKVPPDHSLRALLSAGSPRQGTGFLPHSRQ